MMQETGNYSSILKREGLRNTKLRNHVLEVVEKNTQPVTAEQIYLELKERNISINLSSVYRILDTFVSKGLITKSSINGTSKAIFERSCPEHRHHLICSGCKKILPVDGCPLEEYEKLLKDKTGFDVIGHRLEIYGYCRDCRQVKK